MNKLTSAEYDLGTNSWANTDNLNPLDWLGMVSVRGLPMTVPSNLLPDSTTSAELSLVMLMWGSRSSMGWTHWLRGISPRPCPRLGDVLDSIMKTDGTDRTYSFIFKKWESFNKRSWLHNSNVFKSIVLINKMIFVYSKTLCNNYQMNVLEKTTV